MSRYRGPSVFSLFKSKPRIIPFNAYRPPELGNAEVTPGEQHKTLPFPYPNKYLNSPRPEAASGYKIYFIWNYLP
jgi:hypothetical protein